MGVSLNGVSLRAVVTALCMAALAACVTINENLDAGKLRVQAGQTTDQVIALLGQPPQRKVRGSSEAWQYCTTKAFTDDYLAVFFIDGRVVATENYTHSQQGDCTEFFREVVWDFKSLPAAAREAPPTPQPEEERGGLSTGTGFFITADGDFVTNQHVVDGCNAVYVDGARSARLVAADPVNDLALLRVDADYDDHARIRPGGRAKLGEEVFTFGYPYTGVLSSSGSFTRGHVSSLAGVASDTGKLQITTPIQPGNSGGALVDTEGEVVGVVVAKLDALRFAVEMGDIPQNVNFAINANALSSFLITHGVELPSGSAVEGARSADGDADAVDRVVKKVRGFTRLVVCES